MREITVQTEGDPGTFDLTDKDDPGYYIAKFSHECSENLYKLQQMSFKISQPVAADYTAVENALDTITGTIATWFGTAVAASKAGTSIPATPILPDLTDLLTKVLGSPWLALIAKFGIQIVLHWLRQKLDSETESGEVAQILRKALLLPDPANGEISILELLAAVGVEITINQVGDIQDVHLSRRIE